MQTFLSAKKQVELMTKDDYHQISVNDILYIEAEAKKAKLVLKDLSNMKLDMSLKDCCNLLPMSNFFIISRSVVINLQYVIRFNSLEGYRGQVTLKNGWTFEVSRRRRYGLILALNKRKTLLANSEE